MSLALIFPGQGAQSVGMGKDIYDGSAVVKNLFDSANKILGKNLTQVMFNGPEEDLKKTDYTQPAIFLMSTALYEMVKEKFAGKIAYTAGHSLGEYSALYAAGAFDFETGLKLVNRRGALMQEAATKTSSSMAAVLALDNDKIAELCKKTSEQFGYLTAANFNCPGQTVVSGDMASIDGGEAIAKELGAKRYIKLAVAGAFHSKLMQSAADILKGEISNYAIKDALIPVVANFSAGEVKLKTEFEVSLVNQITGAVRWIESVEYMKAKGVDTFIEIGPGAVLSGLIKKIDKKLKVFNIEKIADIEKVII
ncbi:MAG: ACP S-malonyltransferase [bacterium]